MPAHRSIPVRSLLAAAAMTLFAASPVLARQDAAPAPATADAAASPDRMVVAKGITPEALAVLGRMNTYLRGLQSFAIESRTSRDEVYPSGYKLQRNEQQTLLVKRPDGLRSTTAGDLGNRTFVYDGKKMVLFSRDANAYATLPAPDSVGKLVLGALAAGIDLPMIDVLYQAFDNTLTEQVTHGIVVGEGVIDGVACDHLAFRQPNADWQLWVAKGGEPLPRKIVITTRDTSSPQFESTLRWNLQPAIRADTFAFVPPAGAEAIPFAEPDALAGGAQ